MTRASKARRIASVPSQAPQLHLTRPTPTVGSTQSMASMGPFPALTTTAKMSSFTALPATGYNTCAWFGKPHLTFIPNIPYIKCVAET